MTQIIWSVNTNYRIHQVKLYHSLLGTQLKIWIDNQPIDKSQSLIYYGGRYHLNIDDQTFELVILTNGFKYFYFLLHNDRPIPSDKEITRGISADDLFKSSYLSDLSFWKSLADYLNLNYIPNPEAAWRLRHRLIGTWKGYPILIQRGLRYDIRKTVWYVLVRYYDHGSTDSANRIATDERVNQLLGGKVKSLLQAGQGFALITMPVRKRESPSELAERIKTFFSVVATYTSPIPQDYCEGKECRRIAGQERRLVLVNGNPLILCQDCISKIPEWGKKSEEAYHKAPNNLLPGLIAGFGAAFLGAMVWVAIGFLFDLIAAALAAFILVSILKAMDQVATKRSKTSLSIASGLTILSVTAGQYGQLLLLLFRQGMPLSGELFNTIWRVLFASPSVLYLAYFFTLLGAGVSLWQILSQQKSYFRQAFQPDVEVIHGVSLV